MAVFLLYLKICKNRREDAEITGGAVLYKMGRRKLQYNNSANM